MGNSSWGMLSDIAGIGARQTRSMLSHMPILANLVGKISL